MASAHSNTCSKENRAVLCLEDGTLFQGDALGSHGEAVGEVCFNTSMTGYQEILSDPSYAGQIVTMTAPLIGNVGINPEDMESDRPWVRGFVVREASRLISNWRSRESLAGFLIRHHIPAIAGIDTRQLVRILRDRGAQRGVVSTLDFDRDSLVAKASTWPGLAGMDLTGEVTCHKHYRWEDPLWRHDGHHAKPVKPVKQAKHLKQVVALDFGIKRNILRHLTSSGCQVMVMPALTHAEEILERKPDGLFLSNGPGDPEAVVQGIRTIRKLLKAGLPLFGICLGHQMLALALGGATEKMKFGHRGGNHPVQNLATGRVEITAQNHGFVVRESDLPACLEVTHRSLFDGSMEGMRHKELPVFSVQYHPEASPGPHDAHYLFDRFVAAMG